MSWSSSYSSEASLEMSVPDGFKFGMELKESNDIKGKRDGEWVTLKNWSGCTLACGGGKSYLHRMCIPPRNGGLPC